MIAGQRNRTEIVSLLLEAGANTDIQDEVMISQTTFSCMMLYEYTTEWRNCTNDGCQER